MELGQTFKRRVGASGSARLREVMRVNSARKICQEFFQEIGSSPRAARAAGLINASGCVRNHRTLVYCEGNALRFCVERIGTKLRQT